MYKSLQAGRAIAAILVVLFHLGITISWDKYSGIKEFSLPFFFGATGVDFFFVLSGFIIYHAHKQDIGNPQAFLPYLQKRVSRIYPAYLIIFMGVYILAIMIPQLRDTVPHDIGILIKAMLLVPQEKAHVLSVAWTLQFEMLFYLTFSFALISKQLGRGLILLFLILFSLSKVYSFNYSLSLISSNYIWLFLMGMGCAKLVELKSWSENTPFMFAIAGVSTFVITIFYNITGSHPLEEINIIFSGLSFSFIVIAMVLYEKKGKVFLGNKFIQLIGSSSYALYLIHLPLTSILLKLHIALGLLDYGVIGALIAYIVTFTMNILVSIGFHLIIERPIARKLKGINKEPRYKYKKLEPLSHAP